MAFATLLADEWQSSIITAFYLPTDVRFSFAEFYDRLKAKRFVIYPGKVSQAETFRIGTIGHVFPEDIDQLLAEIGEVVRERGWQI